MKIPLKAMTLVLSLAVPATAFAGTPPKHGHDKSAHPKPPAKPAKPVKPAKKAKGG